jgi:hypothetical protein
MATNNNQKNKQGFGSTSQKQLSIGAIEFLIKILS